MPETEERVTCFAADILAKPQGVCEAARPTLRTRMFSVSMSAWASAAVYVAAS
jgi:hypothetical protein